MTARTGTARYPLARRPVPERLSMEEFARRCGLHPEMVRRLVALGMVPAVRDAGGALWFAPAQVAAVARLQRLRAALPLNYAALGLVVDLLDRITELETALRVRGRTQPVRTRTPSR
jgi:chaperone modulatory protein CbpM